MSYPLDILVQAKASLNTKAAWASCLEELGEGKHCLSTAIGLSYDAHVIFCQANRLPYDYGFTTVFRFNDSHTYEECVAALDKAIEYAKG